MLPPGAIPLPARYEHLRDPAPYRTERERRVLLKVERARKHIGDFHALWRDFMNTQPFKVDRETDEATGGFVDRIRVRRDAPVEDLALIFGDAIHNLRVALDHLVWQLVESNGQSVGDWTKFPICRDGRRYRTTVREQVKGISIEARRALDLLRPYQGGFEPLWTLHQLDIQDKHKLIVVILMQQQSVAMDFGKGLAAVMPEEMREHFIGDRAIPSVVLELRPEDRAIYDGAILFTSADASGMHLDPRYRLEPELAPGQPGAGATVSELVYKSLYIVQRIVKIFARFLQD